MNDEVMLFRLGDEEQAAQVIPDRWRRLAEGAASASEIATLQAEAQQDAQAALLWDRFRPLDAVDEQGIAEAMLTHQRSSRRGPSLWLGAGIAAAAAVAAFAWVGLPNETALPGYGLEASTPDIGYRGGRPAVGDVPRHHPDSALSLIVRPETPVAAPIAVQAFALVQDRAILLRATWELSPSGAARLDAQVSDLLPGRSGLLTLVAVVRPADAPPISSQRLWQAHNEHSPPSGTRWVRYPMHVVTD